MKFKPALYFVHRWLGIAMCLLFALWFATGIVMMYVEYPELTEQERLDTLTELDFSRVQISPYEAYGLAGLTTPLTSLRMINVLDRPAYQYRSSAGNSGVIFADNGELFSGLSEQGALQAVRQSGFYSENFSARYDTLINVDQWTLSSGLNSSRPLHRVKVGDPAGTILYVSDTTGIIVRDANRREIFWNWLGSTIHWIYPKQLRSNSTLWVQVVVYVSLVGIFSVITGGIIGVMRLRLRKPYKGKSSSPYSGFMKWHHILGLFSLVFVSTFIFSGLMSMGPWGIFDAKKSPFPQIERYEQATEIPSLRYPEVSGLPEGLGIKEVGWQSISGQPYLVLHKSAGEALLSFDGVQFGSFDAIISDQITAAVPNLLPAAKLASFELLDHYDNYYYSRHNRFRPLPAYRAKFNDEEATWYHINGTTGELINRVTRISRVERWIYNGLHSLDFQFLLDHRPLWDVIVILLSMLGFIFSITSIVVGWRRLVS